MEAVAVPLADLEFSRLVLGTMTFGSQVAADEAAEMIDACAAEGITAIDSANVYKRELHGPVPAYSR